MPAAVRSYVTAGVALVGASVITAAPITPTAMAAQPQARSVTADVTLTAQSAANILPNMINAFLNAPQAHVDAVNYWAESWAKSGNWWVYSQVNVLGWDPANPDMARSMVDLLLPFKPLSKAYGRAVEPWMAANLPMHNGCSGLPPCNDPQAILSSMFLVDPLRFYTGNGFTFGDPDVEATPQWNPVSSREKYWGYELGEDASADFKNPDGTWNTDLYDPETGKPTELGLQKYPNSYIGWYGETVKLDPNDGWKSVVDYLMEDPEPVKFPTFQEQVTAYRKFGEALAIMFNPFVPQSYFWNPRYSTAAYFVRPFAKWLCPQCNKYDPFMPVGWKPSDGFPEPVNDGWSPLYPWQAKTPTGLPLPTEDYLEPGYVPDSESETSQVATQPEDAAAPDTATLAGTIGGEDGAQNAEEPSDLSRTLQAIQAKATQFLSGTQGEAEQGGTPTGEKAPEAPDTTTPVEPTPPSAEEPESVDTPEVVTEDDKEGDKSGGQEEGQTDGQDEVDTDVVRDAVQSLREKFNQTESGSDANAGPEREAAGHDSNSNSNSNDGASGSSSGNGEGGGSGGSGSDSGGSGSGGGGSADK
ncbi:hypothetical protein [Mycolicibacterium psychrotolerans]|uniref:PE-PPE domain-containing protein n=1 Tax=Mycolicibacterium psychrotolerans TaxID=216929 RepID=A0A7I7MEI0_9MYCO|nr:hypothetical protein [Mycolicibacterium psychrotolerans]BBX70177.1 hypothetical protein MPSYJ_36380 [Mycolicibacterium psychrotolerans]